jgi:hypothetical protein
MEEVRELLTDVLKAAKSNQETVIVFTHHTPVLQGTEDPKYRGRSHFLLSSSFLSSKLPSENFSKHKNPAYTFQRDSKISCQPWVLQLSGIVF